MNNLNKLIIASLLGAGVIVASAHADQLDKDLMQSVSSKPLNATGAYAFVGAGVSASNYHVHDVYRAGFISHSNPSTDKDRVFSHLGFGYGWQIKQNYYTAIEAAYDYSFNHNAEGYGLQVFDVDGTPGAGETYYTVHNSSQLEINSLFGRIFYHNYLGFVKAGFVGSWNKYTIGWNAVGVNPYNGGLIGSVNNFRKGVNLGFGVRMPIAKRMQLVAEYDYMDFFNHGYVKDIAPANVAPSDPDYYVMPHHINDKMHSNNFLVSLLYRI
jgi:hypothetical protein